jgi:PIN domain nuclease of toxin-antitoxin system
MKLLLDTHVLIWWQRDDPRLNPRVRALIGSPEHQAVISWASIWEVTVKYRKGMLPFSGSDVYREALDDRFNILPFNASHFAALETLPKFGHHKDPFDLLLLAQAKAEDMPLVTGDRHMTAYDVPYIGAK